MTWKYLTQWTEIYYTCVVISKKTCQTQDVFLGLKAFFCISQIILRFPVAVDHDDSWEQRYGNVRMFCHDYGIDFSSLAWLKKNW